jgi:hypothetical protein
MSDVTFFEWTIENMKQACDLNGKTNSPIFNLNNYPSAKFALFLEGHIYNSHRTDMFGTTTGCRKRLQWILFQTKNAKTKGKNVFPSLFDLSWVVFVIILVWKWQ